MNLTIDGQMKIAQEHFARADNYSDRVESAMRGKVLDLCNNAALFEYAVTDNALFLDDQIVRIKAASPALAAEEFCIRYKPFYGDMDREISVKKMGDYVWSNYYVHCVKTVKYTAELQKSQEEA